MDQSTITTLVRRGIREPSTVSVNDTEIGASSLRGAVEMGKLIRKSQPDLFNTRISIASNTNVFPWPADSFAVLNVWSMEGNGTAITGAADNGSGAIRITAASHGLADEAIVLIHSVLGCTEANGTGQITYVDADTFDLYGSTFANAYTSGGRVFEETTDFDKLTMIDAKSASNSNDSCYFMRGKNIVVDDPDFTYDIIVDYIALVTAISQIPPEYHLGLVAWAVVEQMRIPAEDHRTYNDKVASYAFHKKLWDHQVESLEGTFRMSDEAFNLE